MSVPESTPARRFAIGCVGCIPFGAGLAVAEHTFDLSTGWADLMGALTVGVYVFFVVPWVMLGHLLFWRVSP